MKEKLTRVQLKRSTEALLLEHRAAEKIAHAQAQDCPQVVHRKCRKAVAAKPCRDSRHGLENAVRKSKSPPYRKMGDKGGAADRSCLLYR